MADEERRGRGFAMEDLYRLTVPADPQLTADGRRLVCVVARADRADDRDTSALWEIPLDGDGAPRPLTEEGAGDCTAPRWSPDGKWLAFLRTEPTGHDTGVPQLWLL